MTSIRCFNAFRYVWIVALLVAPFASIAGKSANSQSVIYNLAEEPIIAQLRPASKDENPPVSQAAEKPSEFWKYGVALLALVFFLGIALFIQIRSEREK